MWYLISSLFWWLLAALAFGAFVGWQSCKKRPVQQGLGWVALALLVLAVGALLAHLAVIPGKLGFWFETALLFLGAYLIGCCIGCLFGRSATAEVAKPAAVAAAATAVAAAPKPAPAPVPAGPALVRPYQWQAAKDGTSVTLTGYVPSEDARGRVVTSAKTTLAPAAIVDKLQLASGAPAGLEAMASTAFGHLAKLDKGIASLIDTKYTLTGIAGTQPNYDSVMSGVKALAPGFSLAKVDIVAPPVAKPAPVMAKPAAPVAKPAPKPVAVKAAPAKPAGPKPAPKIAGEDKVPGKRPAGYASARGGVADDLKLIRGIGRQNEGRLHGLGIWHFDQIASWNAQESLWVGSYLAFPGRIEREEWVKQAKVLATGKQTEFSKRAKAGMVATSADDGSKGGKNVSVVKPMRAVKGAAPAKTTKPKGK
jgi:predicted flap endonuclease-1-like 5' DNA nuclease